MRSALLAVVATVFISGCADVEQDDAAATEQELGGQGVEATGGGAATNLIGEGTYWKCLPSSHLYLSETQCLASCTHSCRLVVVCTTGTGQQVPCP